MSKGSTVSSRTSRAGEVLIAKSDRDTTVPDVGALSLEFVEGLYADFVREPESVPEVWRRWFEEVADGEGRPDGWSGRPSFPASSIFHGNGGRRATPVDVGGAPAEGAASLAAERRGREQAELTGLQHRVDKLIRNYRVRGHIIAAVDPLERPRPQQPELDPAFYGFTEVDLDRPFAGQRGEVQTLRDILERLHDTYCRSIGVQFMHIDNLEVREWLQRRMESTRNRIDLSRERQVRILTRLTDAVIFEEFIQKKYVGAKSFSLEGAESLIPLLDLAFDKAGEQGIERVVIGMAHRGRLNVLANIIGKSPQKIFREFEDIDPEVHVGRGDVKYHLGYDATWECSGGAEIDLSLCFNPSHLEFVNPVAVGRMRAQQDRMGDAERRRGMVLLIHGDAAFTGEGIVQETLNLSQLEAYSVGGTLHVVVNNQLGFTTPPEEQRSSRYPTDVARMLQAPIFHVNGEDAEAVAAVVDLAMDFRDEFQRDVFIDMYCYRRRGHNEGDEPSFTQPLMYDVIDAKDSVRDCYLEHLLQLDEITRQEADDIGEARREHLERELSAARSQDFVLEDVPLDDVWEGYRGGPEEEVQEVDTGVETERLSELLDATTRFPDDFHPHPKIERLLPRRREMVAAERPLDWSAAEALAFATLATEGIPVRLTGQDSARGTFSQRHAVLHDVEDGRAWETLGELAPEQARVEIRNSPLSEAGVLGFEYGYSLDAPGALVLWEAQFGDFANAAQVIIDQFIASSEDKWGRLSGVVLLLPHAFEGQGPEHSSARLERFLQLAAEDNIQVAYPTTPAQNFHLLRRQALRRWRKPLVVMTPKSLLRHPEATSDLEELAPGTGFRRVIPDDSSAVDSRGADVGVGGEDPGASGDEAGGNGEGIGGGATEAGTTGAADRVLLCSGKVYYDLLQRREELGRGDVAIVRVEQLYPLQPRTERELAAALAPYADDTPAYWVQEEPENMGAWRYLDSRWGDRVLGRLPLAGVCRPPSASPATGSKRSHQLEQERLMDRAFGTGDEA